MYTDNTGKAASDALLLELLGEESSRSNVIEELLDRDQLNGIMYIVCDLKSLHIL